MDFKLLPKASLSAGFPIIATTDGLALTPRRRPCMTYANGCVCPDCTDRATPPDVAVVHHHQPWEPKAAA